jgi:hypothetical protein
MVGEAIAGLGALKTAFDMAKGLKDISDATIRNAAVIELQEKILSAQHAQSALIERIGSLEKEVAGHETWEAEKNRYRLTDYGGGTFAYELKPEEASGEPSHRICAACYQQRQKSILQHKYRTVNQQEKFVCPGCKSEFALGTWQPAPPTRYTIA